jgi:hypothetical protein
MSFGLAAIVAIGTTGCGSSGTSQRDFRTQANQVCATFGTKARSIIIEPYGTRAQEFSGLRNDFVARQTEIAMLIRVKAPQGKSLLFGRFIAGARRLNGTERAMLHELATGKSLRFESPLFARFAAIVAKQKELAYRLNLAACAHSSGS